LADEPTQVEQEVEAIAEAVLEGKDAIEIPANLIAEESEAGDAAAPPPAASSERPFAAPSPPHEPEVARFAGGSEVAPSRELIDMVQEMTVGQRIKAALKGNKDARTILLHDPNPMVRKMVLQNPRVTDQEVLAVARDRTAPAEVLRMIADKREWATHYAIRTALLANPRAPLNETRSFATAHERERAARGHEREARSRDAERSPQAAPAAEKRGEAAELPVDPVDAEREVNAIAEAIRQGTDTIDVPDDFTNDAAAREISEEAKSLYARIKNMSVPQKVKLAMKGNKDARQILIRDTNKLIQRMVLQNARITEDEILMLAKDRNTEKEVLRLIADSKEWLKSYAIRLALVENAKTALGDSLRLMPGLAERDLKNLSRSKNVPSTIAAQARKMMSQREQAQRGPSH
jgi:hypothetical protein